MYRYIIKRLVLSVFVIFAVSFLVFAILDFAPGDPVLQILGVEASDEEIETLREQLGYNDPLMIKYTRYISKLSKGDWGYSQLYKMKVLDLYKKRIPNTLKLAAAALFLSAVFAIPAGIYSAIHHGKIRDNIVSVFSLVGLSTPNFWVGLMLIILFSLKLKWLPSGGVDKPGSVILPAITLGTSQMALMARTTRSSMLDVIRQDYLLLARAKGVSEKKVIRKHALKNALIPIITVIGLQFGNVIAGSVLTETVFNWPGIGQLTIKSVSDRDLPTLLACIIMTTIFVSISLLVVDLLYAFVNPRIRSQYTK